MVVLFNNNFTARKKLSEKRHSKWKAFEILVEILLDRNIIEIPLVGQVAFSNTYSKEYWDKNSNSIYLDGKDLPKAPEGKVPSLVINFKPIYSFSLATISDFNTNKQ